MPKGPQTKKPRLSVVDGGHVNASPHPIGALIAKKHTANPQIAELWPVSKKPHVIIVTNPVPLRLGQRSLFLLAETPKARPIKKDSHK